MKFGERVAAFARAHVDCSVHHNQGLYLESVAPAVDRTADAGRRYFLAGPSTCALYACRCVADCEEGLSDPEFNDPELTRSYVTEIGTAVANIQTVFERRGALERYTPYGQVGGQTLPLETFAEGDIPIIDGPPYGVHVRVCVVDVELLPDGSWRGDICEGGQADGGVVLSKGATWHVRKDAHGQPRLFAGDGQRYVIAVCRARKMDLDLDAAPGDKTGAPDSVPTMRTGRAVRGEDAGGDE